VQAKARNQPLEIGKERSVDYGLCELSVQLLEVINIEKDHPDRVAWEPGRLRTPLIEVSLNLSVAVKDSELLLKLPLVCGYGRPCRFEKLQVASALKLYLCLPAMCSSYLQPIVIEFCGDFSSLSNRHSASEQFI
jgi:hypothetical protein